MVDKVGDPLSLPLRLEDQFGRGYAYTSLAAAQAAGWTFLWYQAAALMAAQPALTLTPNPDLEVGDFFIGWAQPAGVCTLKIRATGSVAGGRAAPEKYPVSGHVNDMDSMVSFLANAQGTLISNTRASQFDWEYVEGDTFVREMQVPAAALTDLGYTDLSDLTAGAWTVACYARAINTPPTGNPPNGAPTFILNATISDKALRKIKIRIPAALTGAIIDYTTGNQVQVQYDAQLSWPLALSIIGVNTGSKTFTVAGDQLSYFGAGSRPTISGSTGNNNGGVAYNVVSAVYNGTNTVITVSDTVASAVADGTMAITGKISPIKGTITILRQQTTSP